MTILNFKFFTNSVFFSICCFAVKSKCIKDQRCRSSFSLESKRIKKMNIIDNFGFLDDFSQNSFVSKKKDQERKKRVEEVKKIYISKMFLFFSQKNEEGTKTHIFEPFNSFCWGSKEKKENNNYQDLQPQEHDFYGSEEDLKCDEQITQNNVSCSSLSTIIFY